MGTPEQNIPTEDSQDQNSQRDGQDSTQQPEVTEPSSPRFAGTRIEGRDDDFATNYIQTLERAVMEQRQQLNQQTASEPPRQPVVEAPKEKTDFFEDPYSATQSVIREEMERQFSPLKKQIESFAAQSREESLWDQVKAKYADLDQWRPVMENLMTEVGIGPERRTAEVIEHFYHTARGRALVTETGRPPTAQAPASHIPQHRPSSAPPPSASAPKTRQATEAERRLAREWGMSVEEYLNMQDETLDFDDYREGEASNG